ncbi:MAG: dephospho-CoA kinase [Granulosicoccus sp.]
MLLVGLTGGIASGKTLVSDYFKSLDVPVLDADVLAREVVEPGSKGLNALTRYFTTAILTPKGELDRAALRRIVFANPSDREFLDKTLHPLIRELSDEKIQQARHDNHAYLIYAVPLLIETGQQDRFDRIVAVDVPRETQLLRLLKRDDSNEAEANAILDAQASREDRLAIADNVIDNTGSVEDTYKQINELHTALLSEAKR